MSEGNRRAIRHAVWVTVTIIVTLGLHLPDALRGVGIDPASIPGFGLFVVFSAGVARLAQTGAVDAILTRILNLGQRPRTPDVPVAEGEGADAASV